MSRFDELPPETQEAICTPFHNILPPTSSHLGALYLGSLAAVLDADRLRALNITAIVQVLDVPWLVLTEEEGFTCYKVDIEDRPTQSLDEDLLERVCAYIDDMRNQGTSVLVHCQQGVSRSASIVIAYLISRQHMAYDEALLFVREKRACIRPNKGFIKCLRAWERRVHGPVVDLENPSSPISGH